MENPPGLSGVEPPTSVTTSQPNPNPSTWEVTEVSPQRYLTPPVVVCGGGEQSETTVPTFTTIGQAISHPSALSALGMQLSDGQNFHPLPAQLQPVFTIPAANYDSCKLEDYQSAGLVGGAIQPGSVAMTLPTTTRLHQLQQVLNQAGERKVLPSHLQMVPLFDPAGSIPRNLSVGQVSMATMGSLCAPSLSLGVGLHGGGLPMTTTTSVVPADPSNSLTNATQPTATLIHREQLVSQSTRDNLVSQAQLPNSILSAAPTVNHPSGLPNQTIFPLMQTQYRTTDTQEGGGPLIGTAESQSDSNIQLVLSKQIADTFHASENEPNQANQSPVYHTVQPGENFHSAHLSMTQSLGGVKLDPSSLHSQDGTTGVGVLSGMEVQTSEVVSNERLLSGSHDAVADISANQMLGPGSADLQLLPQTSQSMMGMNIRHLNNQMGAPPEDSNRVNTNLDSSRQMMDICYNGHDGMDNNMFMTRKSQRLAERDKNPSPVQRAVYMPKEFYNTCEMWCEECQESYDPECPRHKQSDIYDKVVLSRAWATLPTLLQIFRLGDTPELGVFARKTIPKRTRFGPFFAPLVDSTEQVTNKNFLLKIENEDGSRFFLEATDENCCNWMMFVRPAATFDELNMVAYQYKTDIYFTTTKNVDACQELKVWYAASYAHRMGTQPLQPPPAVQSDALDENSRWPCYECNKGFRSSAQLQRHLCVHDDMTLDEDGMDDVDDDTEGEGKPARRGRRRGTQSKGGKAKPKKIKELVGEDSTVFQSWKKRKTNMYLNKIKKYREPIKRSLMTLYKKQGKDTGGNEWVCTHCDLTFDNPSLLNLHTLTHAAEDLAMVDLNSTFTPSVVGAGDNIPAGDVMFSGNPAAAPSVSQDSVPPVIQWDETNLQCPVCNKIFQAKQELILHASEHARKGGRQLCFLPRKPFKCMTCWKSFTTDERLQRHLLCHNETTKKPFKCTTCSKSFMNNSALACHLKTHSDKKYYECTICKEGFDQIHAMKNHILTHARDGMYDCPDCHKSFPDYPIVRRHIRGFHSDKRYRCPECQKEFPRQDKLKLHMLKHSNDRDFMCDICGRQFKRKDKLKEHTKRMHNPHRENRPRVLQISPKKFTPKVEPNDYNRFIYKCHECLLGFKRRGMLVNHLAKRHPDMKPDDIPELNLPILRTQRDYFCQYCDKIYKSSSKRKLHILKYHPGGEVPPSVRSNQKAIQNTSFSEPAGSITTMPHSCILCYKQYASKAKLLQHQRKKHPTDLNDDKRKYQVQLQAGDMALTSGILDKPRLLAAIIQKPLDNSSPEVIAITPQAMQGLESIQGTDLLTQAMSELTPALTEFRTHSHGPGSTIEYQLTGLGTPTTSASLVHPASLQTQSTMIDLGQLTSSLGQTQVQRAVQGTHILQQAPASIQHSQIINPATITVVRSTQAGQVFSGTLPITLTSPYIQKNNITSPW